MLQLAIILRSIQLFAHSAHHLVARTPFFQDHEFFGDLYKEAESDYDSVIERIIGLHGEEHVELNSILAEVVQKVANCPSIGVKENKAFYEYQLQFEKELCELIEVLCKNPQISQGTIQKIGDIADRSERRQYLIQQRIKG